MRQDEEAGQIEGMGRREKGERERGQNDTMGKGERNDDRGRPGQR